MKPLASEVYCRMMVYEKPTAILAWLLGGETFRELLSANARRAAVFTAAPIKFICPSVSSRTSNTPRVIPILIGMPLSWHALARAGQETLSGIVYTDSMLTYTTLQDRPREFLAATGLRHAEFAHLLPAFAAAYARRYPRDKTLEGKPCPRRAGGGATGTLPQMDDKLLCILVFQKTHPCQTMHGLQFQLSQPQTNDWIHHLLPVLQQA